MSTVKINLKNAKEAIVAKKYEEALKWAEKVLDADADNYMGYVGMTFVLILASMLMFLS